MVSVSTHPISSSPEIYIPRPFRFAVFPFPAICDLTKSMIVLQNVSHYFSEITSKPHPQSSSLSLDRPDEGLKGGVKVRQVAE
jgi:hypothetical protein